MFRMSLDLRLWPITSDEQRAFALIKTSERQVTRDPEVLHQGGGSTEKSLWLEGKRLSALRPSTFYCF